MATARAISILDIVAEIVEHVDAVEPASERRRSLVSLVHVSRIFSAPAGRMLWRNLPNIEPLFRLLSNCVVVRNESDPEAQSAYTLVSRSFCWFSSPRVALHRSALCSCCSSMVSIYIRGRALAVYFSPHAEYWLLITSSLYRP